MSIVTRWFLFIVPILAILWIPAILQLTTYPNAEVSDHWQVKIIDFTVTNRFGGLLYFGGLSGYLSFGLVSNCLALVIFAELITL